MSENSESEIDPCERRVIYVEPITGDNGSIEVHAVYRYGGAESNHIDHHTFSFGYHYLAEERRCSLGMDEWDHPSATVTAIDMAVLKYVKAYFNEYGLSVAVSIPISDRQVSEFEADASLQIRPEPEDTNDSTQWIEES